MRIAFATLSNLPNPSVLGGAVETLIDNICNENEIQNELEIDIYSIDNEKAKEISNKYNNTNYIYYKRIKNKKFSKKNLVYKLTKISLPDRTMDYLSKEINKKSYDFVIITSINAEFKYMFRNIKSKVIWYLHGDLVSVLPKKIIRDIFKECFGIITVSDYIKSRVLSVGADCKVVTLRNCSDLIPISKDKEKETREAFRNSINVELDQTLYLFYGRITPIKGIKELIIAFNNANLSNSKLLILGRPSDHVEEEYNNELKRIANKDVIFYGYLEHSQLNKALCASDVVIVPSICNEAAGLSLIEAKRCNKTIIATNIGGIPEYADGAVLVDYDDNFVDNLSSAIKNVNISSHLNIDDYSTKDFYNQFVKIIYEF